MAEHSSKQVFFSNVTKDKSEKHDKAKDFEKSKKSEETDAYSNNNSLKPDNVKKLNDAESETSISHIKNIDLYDRLNFQRIQIKRSSIKYKTNICKAPKLNIQKFTDEIYKYVEDIQPQQTMSGQNVRKRTIKFSTQKVTYQYPKIKEVITSNFSEISNPKITGIDETYEENEDNKDKVEEKEANSSSKGIFVFGEHNEDDDEHSHEQVDSDKQHIDLTNNYEEK